MNLEFRNFTDVNAAAYNPRTTLKPTDPEWKDIEASIEKYGQVQNLVLNKRTNHVVGGHQRINVMKHRGTQGAWFHVVDLEPEEEQRLNVILNKVTGRWDKPKLTELLKGMKDRKVDLAGLGFTAKELGHVIGGTGAKQKRNPDNAPALPKKAVTQPGHLYVLSSPAGTNHRLLCGKSEDGEAMAKLANGVKARIAFTDPPYGVSYQSSNVDLPDIANDELREQGLADFLTRAFQTAGAHLHEKAAFYCFYASRNHIQFEQALLASGWEVRQQLIWAKQMVLGRSHYHWAHEPILYAGRSGGSIEWFGDRAEKTIFERTDADIERLSKEEAVTLLKALKQAADVWDEKRDPPSTYIHPTQKPISLAQRAIRNSTLPGDTVLEQFAGSGSTMIAAETLGRFSLNMEMDPPHCDAIVRRFLETFEGATATRDGGEFTIADLQHA